MEQEPTAPVTPKDIVVLQTLATADTIASAANTLGISTRQLHRNTQAIRAKLGVGSTRAVVAVAVSRGWIEAPETPSKTGHELGED